MRKNGRYGKIFFLITALLLCTGCGKNQAAPSDIVNTALPVTPLPSETPVNTPAPDFFWSSYTNGNEVDQLALDGEGNVWAVGEGGVVVWGADGAYKKYTTMDGLVSNRLISVAVTSAGTAWFGTISRGISSFDGSTWTTYEKVGALDSNWVSAIAATPDGNIWFGTDNGGIAKFDGSQWETMKETGSIFSQINSIIMGTDKTMWFGTDAGAWHFDGAEWKEFDTDKEVKDIAVSPDGTVWLATNDGLVNNAQGTMSHLLSGNFKSVEIGPDGAVWVGTEMAGIWRYADGETTKYTTEDGLLSNYIVSIAISPTGEVWAGSPESGLSKFEGGEWKNFRTEDPVQNWYADALATDDGSVWVLSAFNDLMQFDGTHWISYPQENLPSYYVFSNVIARTPDDQLLIGTTDGLSIFNIGTKEWLSNEMNESYPGGTIDSIFVEESGEIWVVSRINGLFSFQENAWQSYDVSGIGELHTVSVGSDGLLWVGGDGGIASYDKDSWTKYTTEDGLAGNWVNEIIPVENGAIWIGTSKGLSFFDKTSWNNYTSINDVKENGVSSMAWTTHNEIWVGPFSGGAVKYDGRTWTK
ncbi:MAG: two-component regulator propeller domain-containing protein, partial [Anaerolineales bacterium]